MIISLIPWTTLNANFTIFESLTNWLTNLPVLGTVLGKSMLPLGDWYFPEITMLFLVMSIVVAITYGMKESEFVSEFLAGASDLIGVAIVVAVARGIQVVMNNGLITDTILHWGEQGLSSLSSSVFIIITFIFYIPMSFLIPSTSGLAAATMGIMGPMGEFLRCREGFSYHCLSICVWLSKLDYTNISYRNGCCSDCSFRCFSMVEIYW